MPLMLEGDTVSRVIGKKFSRCRSAEKMARRKKLNISIISIYEEVIKRFVTMHRTGKTGSDIKYTHTS